MATRPRKMYSAALGKMVPMEDADSARRASATGNVQPVYDDVTVNMHPDRRKITQRIMEFPGDQPDFDSAPVDKEVEYENFLHSIYDAVIITDMDGNITDINARATHSFLWNRANLLTFNVLSLISGADEKVLTLIKESMTENKFTILEAICLREDESTFNAEIVANKLRGDGVAKLCFFMRDITERKRMEEELEQTTDMLVEAEKLQARMDTLSTVMHAINNPLQILACKAELDDDKEYKQQLDRIMAVIDQLKKQESLEAIVDEADGSTRYDFQEEPVLTDCDMERIMVVDDERSLRDMFVASIVARFPEKTVESAGDGEEALKLFQESFPGVIVMDISMPRMNGIDAYHAIVEVCRQASRKCPSFVFCTGFSMDDDLRGLVEEGSGNICVEKPLSLSYLTEAVQSRLLR